MKPLPSGATRTKSGAAMLCGFLEFFSESASRNTAACQIMILNVVPELTERLFACCGALSGSKLQAI